MLFVRVFSSFFVSSSRFVQPAGRPAHADATKSRGAFVLAAIRRWKRIQRIVGLLHGYRVFSAHQRKEQSRPCFTRTHTCAHKHTHRHRHRHRHRQRHRHRHRHTHAHTQRGPWRILFSKEALCILGISRDPGYFINNQRKSSEPSEPSEWSIHPSPSSSLHLPWINQAILPPAV